MRYYDDDDDNDIVLLGKTCSEKASASTTQTPLNYLIFLSF